MFFAVSVLWTDRSLHNDAAPFVTDVLNPKSNFPNPKVAKQKAEAGCMLRFLVCQTSLSVSASEAPTIF